MKCPWCDQPTSVVYGYHLEVKGLPTYRRRRYCTPCNKRFTTNELTSVIDPIRLGRVKKTPVGADGAPQGEACVSTSNSLP